MKQTNFLKSFFLLFALIVGSSSVWGSTVTYTVTSRTAVSTTGTAPTNSSASFVNTYTGNNKDQMTGSNSQTLTLSNYNGYQITGLTLSMKSNGSSGSGKLRYSTDGGTSWTYLVGSAQSGVAFNDAAWHGSYTTTYTNVTKSPLNIICGTSNIVIKIEATANSLYCQSYTVTYEAAKTLDHISVTTPPTKTTYKIGEPVDLTDMVVTATYTDESTENVTSKCTFNPASGATLDSSGDQNIAISYSGKNTTQAITVASVTGLAVKTAPTTVKYRIGDYLDLTGLVLTATYSDEGTKDITDFTASPADGSALNTSGNVDVTLSYYGQNCTQRVTVGNLSSITYNATGVGAFANTTYTEKDTFNPEGLVITAHFDNDLDVEASGYTLSPTTETELATSDKKITVSYTWNEVNKTVDIPITVNAGAKYTVSFDAGNGAYTGGNITETEYQGGITLPAATIDLDGWVFAGWAAASQTSTQNRPILYLAGETYYPTDNVTLYAVYSLDGIDGTKYQRVTELSQATSASTIIIVSNKYNKVLDNALGSVNAPTETEGKITPSDNIVWSLSGNNTDGFELTTTALSTNNTLGRSLIPTTNGNIELTTDNNKWIVEEHTGGTNLFVLKNKTNPSDNTKVGVLEYNATPSKWQYYCMAASTYKTSNDYSKSQLYIPVKTVYNSNPAAAIIQPTVAFEKGNTTLYLDGTTTYTNAASVTGVAKSVTGYKSSNESVATVDASGVVNAVGIGTATITAYLDIELGVHKAAEASYEVTVKNTTTIAGLKTIDSTSGKAFTADLTNAVVTYVKGSYAYIQDASAAILVNKSDHGLIAGQKINGAVSGTVKITNSIDQLTAINLSAATVTEDGVIPEALTKTVAEVRANAASLDGQLVTINAVTIDKSNTTTTLKDGSKIGEVEATITMYSPNTAASVNDKEKGNFTGYISLYNGETPRINLYEQSQFVKTYNAPTAQTLTFDEDDVNLDEDTEALANYVGQAVNGAHTTLTWSVEDGSDDILTSLNASTGALVLNGSIGAAIIKVTAAAEEVEEAGVITPYLAANASYMITVNPRYSVTFSVNGIETVLRQSTSGATIAVPTPGDLGDYTFVGWSTSTVDPTDDAPSMTDLGATVTPENNNGKYYAVFAKEKNVQTPGEITSTLTLNSGTVSSPYVNNGVTWTFSGLDFVSSGNGDMPNGSTVTFTLPVTATSTVSVNAPAASGWSTKNISIALTDANSTNIATFNNGISYTFTSDNNKSSAYTLTATNADNRKAYMNTITVVYNGLIDDITYSDYRTSLPTVEVTISDSKYLSFCYGSKLDFTETDVKAYKASVDVEGNVTLTKVDVVPAEEGVVLHCETPGTYAVPVTDASASDVTGNQMVGVIERTQVLWNPSDGVYNYILQQGVFKKATDGYLKPNRAYLSTSYNVATPTAKPLTIIFNDDETDGIKSVQGSEFMVNGEAYNLSGQRVGNDYKGIVIVNGKKYLRK